MRTFADFSNQLLALKETLKKEEIANVAGDGAVSMPPTAKKVKRKSKTFNVSPQLFDIFRINNNNKHKIKSITIIT